MDTACILFDILLVCICATICTRMVGWIASNFINIILVMVGIQSLIEVRTIVVGWKPYADKTQLIEKSLFRIIGAGLGWALLLTFILFALSGFYDYDAR